MVWWATVMLWFTPIACLGPLLERVGVCMYVCMYVCMFLGSYMHHMYMHTTTATRFVREMGLQALKTVILPYMVKTDWESVFSLYYIFVTRSHHWEL